MRREGERRGRKEKVKNEEKGKGSEKLFLASLPALSFLFSPPLKQNIYTFTASPQTNRCFPVIDTANN